jgi:putative endonuclease
LVPPPFVIPAQAGIHLLGLPMRDGFDPMVYLLASHRNGTLYAGVTSNLLRRLHQHREGLIEGFTKDYGVHHLVWFEQHATMEHAITREKRIKKWNRAWKVRLIEEANPDWRDLAVDLGFDPLPSRRIA